MRVAPPHLHPACARRVSSSIEGKGVNRPSRPLPVGLTLAGAAAGFRLLPGGGGWLRKARAREAYRRRA